MRRAVRRPGDAWTALAAIAATALAAWAVSPGTVGGLERSVFRFVNGWPDAWRPVLWVFQLLGLLGTPLLVAAVALLLRRWRLALALALLPLVKLVVEKDVLKALVRRERPGTTIPGAVLRNVPSAGPSFPSGHAIIAFGIAVLLLPYLRRRWQVVVVVLAVLNSVARVYLGGHAPLDVIGGGAAGIAIGALLSLVVGVQIAGTPRAARGGRAGRNAAGAPTGSA
jgi:membrane-associated phospholipid phosphatase